MRPAIDMTGQVCGRLTVIERSGSTAQGLATWKCQCSCGVIVTVAGGHLRSGASTSCGCAQRDLMRTRQTTHGMHGTTIYIRWQSMINRCEVPTSTNYIYYGARGIKVCERWHSFELFYEDMNAGFSDDLQIDRIDSTKNYEPGNCRWATVTEQARNRRSNRAITWKGRTKIIVEWSEETRIPATTILGRLNDGWDIERALTQPVRGHKSAGEEF